MKEKFNPYNHFGFLTNRGGRLIAKRVAYDMKQQGFDMPSSCIGILAELWVQDGLESEKVGDVHYQTKSSINKMLQQMIAADLIVKKTDERDRRVSQIFLTEKGKSLEKKIIRVSSRIEESLLTEHSIKEIETAKKVLTTLYHKLIDHETTNNQI